MAELEKVASGIIYNEDFSNGLSLLWDYSHDDITNRVVQNSDSISISPNNKRFELFIKTPSKDGYVYQTKVEYKPSDTSERAGLIFRSITENYAFVEINDELDEKYEFIKADFSDGSTLSVKAFNGTDWVNVGNTTLADSNSIGMYMDKTSKKDNFKIFNCNIYKDNFIYINALDKSYIIKIFDKNGKDLSSDFYIRKMNNRAVIDGTNSIFPIDELRIDIIDSVSKEIITSKHIHDVFGGDVFTLNNDISVLLDGTVLNTSVYDLGEVDTENVYTLTIKNNELYKINKNIKIKCENSFNGGDVPVFISRSVNKDFQKELTVDFNPLDSKDFYIKVVNDGKITSIEDKYKFKIFIG